MNACKFCGCKKIELYSRYTGAQYPFQLLDDPNIKNQSQLNEYTSYYLCTKCKCRGPEVKHKLKYISIMQAKIKWNVEIFQNKIDDNIGLNNV